MTDRVIGHISERGPDDHCGGVWFKMAKWF